ncbi:hypothetical protein C5S29_03995 [ANME-1 cluster archaeon GoMg3.2]|nr:hypothetical protein [ANME-1 cluster archaeon GoMg3.2]
MGYCVWCWQLWELLLFSDASLLVDSVSTVNLETVLSSNLTDLNFGMKQYLGFFLLRF